MKNFYGYCGNTLYDDGFKDKKFDCIVGNYPFSIKWEQIHDERFDIAPVLAPAGKADYAFILHMLYHLSNDGVCVCMGFPGILYCGNAEGKIRQWLVEQNYIERVVSIPGNTFEDTTIATCLLIIKRNKKNTDIVFEDKELNKERKVSLEEIKKNNFNLSVNTYIQKEIEKEEIDPIQLELDAEDAIIKKLLNSIEFTKATMELEERNDIYINFVQRIEKTIRELMEQENIKPLI